MQSYSFEVNEGQVNTDKAPFLKPTGTVVAKFYTSKDTTIGAEIAGVITWDASNMIFTLSGAQSVAANFASRYTVTLAVDGAGAYTALTGVIRLVPAVVVQPITQSGLFNVGQTGTWAVNGTNVKATTGGLSRYRLLSAATTNINVVKASAGQVYTVHAYNTSAAVKFLKFYNKATAAVLATDVPVETYPLQPTTMTRINITPFGSAFALGIGVAITGLVADTDVTVLALNDVVLNVHYA